MPVCLKTLAQSAGYALVLGIAATSISAKAGVGDLLVAPTRVILDNNRGTEVILNNNGSEEATYRISLELKRMTADGSLEPVTEGAENPTEVAARNIIQFAPRRVTLAPNQPQAIRIGLRAPPELPDGEYRAHMLFRAIPKAQPVTENGNTQSGLSIQLTPVYGVTIPIIVRKGNLTATAAISNPRLETGSEGNFLSFDLSRNGSRSVFGEIRVTRPGISEPLLLARGIAIYPEIFSRTVNLPLRDGQLEALNGDAKIALYESPEAGGDLITEIRAPLRVIAQRAASR